MARINRFYLFIAALVMSKTYDASAATKLPLDTCYDIRKCCAPWFKLAANDPDQTITDTVYHDPMMQECCESRYSTSSSNYYSCMMACMSTDSSTIDSTYCETPNTSDPTATVDCDTASDIDSRKAELHNTDYITYSSAYANICGPMQWAEQNADGSLREGISKCYNDDWDYDTVLFEYICGGKTGCYNYAKEYVQCDDGGSGGGDEPSYIPPSCISGEYWNLWGAPGLGANGGAGSCTTCPTYNYASGKYFSDLASSSQRNDDTSAAGSGGNIRFCYVPRGNVFTDNSGTFQYVNDCYYGS